MGFWNSVALRVTAGQIVARLLEQWLCHVRLSNRMQSFSSSCLGRSQLLVDAMPMVIAGGNYTEEGFCMQQATSHSPCAVKQCQTGWEQLRCMLSLCHTSWCWLTRAQHAWLQVRSKHMTATSWSNGTWAWARSKADSTLTLLQIPCDFWEHHQTSWFKLQLPMQFSVSQEDTSRFKECIQ